MDDLASIQPIVLVGGRSRRFGRDKLLETVSDDSSASVLVDRPIGALRGVFGSRVALVGECDDRVQSCGDLHLTDEDVHRGPAAGIESALRHFQGAVFVLAGDLIGVTSECVTKALRSAAEQSDPWCVVARCDGLHPCFGLYREPTLDIFTSARGTDGRLPPLRELAMEHGGGFFDCPARCVQNVNTPADLARHLPSA